MLKLKTHSGSMIYFDSDMSKSINTVVYFDWKTVIYIYDCGKCRTQFMYRSLQVYQRSNSQVGHRVLSDFTLKIVRQMPRQNPPRSERESPLSDS
jgi:hypothetical protein